MDDPYKVKLNVFSGPMDLLLYLVSREEVDVYDIPVAGIVDQYMEYLDGMRESDIEVTGEFIVMASTLMLIKSRLLLPTEEVDLEEEIDPRDDLIRRLLEYKKYKTLSRALEERGLEQDLKEGRPKIAGDPSLSAVSLEEVDLYDLVKAFARVLDDTGQGWGTTIVHSEKPVSSYIDEILSALRNKGSLLFSDLFAGPHTREEALGLFVGLLELCRLAVVRVSQVDTGGPISIDCLVGPDRLNSLKARNLESLLLDGPREREEPLWLERKDALEMEAAAPESAADLPSSREVGAAANKASADLGSGETAEAESAESLL